MAVSTRFKVAVVSVLFVTSGAGIITAFGGIDHVPFEERPERYAHQAGLPPQADENDKRRQILVVGHSSGPFRVTLEKRTGLGRVPLEDPNRVHENTFKRIIPVEDNDQTTIVFTVVPVIPVTASKQTYLCGIYVAQTGGQRDFHSLTATPRSVVDPVECTHTVNPLRK